MASIPTHEELLARWPKTAGGEPEASVFLTELPDLDGAADMTASMLEAYGIPVLRKYRKSAGRAILGGSWQRASLYVPRSRLEEAQGLLEPAEESG